MKKHIQWLWRLRHDYGFFNNCSKCRKVKIISTGKDDGYLQIHPVCKEMRYGGQTVLKEKKTAMILWYFPSYSVYEKNSEHVIMHTWSKRQRMSEVSRTAMAIHEQSRPWKSEGVFCYTCWPLQSPHQHNTVSALFCARESRFYGLLGGVTKQKGSRIWMVHLKENVVHVPSCASALRSQCSHFNQNHQLRILLQSSILGK